jgi:ribonuclease T1
MSNIPLTSINQLPPEVLTIINLVRQGGVFPYPQDGKIFSNREGILPSQPIGYYQEYTVPTPGISDRGRRRLVMGQGNEIYYTDNHYNSFVKIS